MNSVGSIHAAAMRPMDVAEDKDERKVLCQTGEMQVTAVWFVVRDERPLVTHLHIIAIAFGSCLEKCYIQPPHLLHALAKHRIAAFSLNTMSFQRFVD